MKRQYLILYLLLFISCSDSLILNTSKNIYHDDIADITYLNHSFFTTNHDLSHNAGSQIDLLSYEIGQDHIYLDNSFSLGLNGQGYLAITNNGTDLFLHSRNTHLIFKMSQVGELAFTKIDTIDKRWIPSGIAFDQLKDSIIFMYKNSDQNNEYRLRLTSMDISETSTRDTLFILSDLDSTSQGVYSIAYGDSNLYLLTANQNNHTLLTLDYYTLAVKTTEIIEDSTLAGIEIVSDSIYFSYKDKKIEPY